MRHTLRTALPLYLMLRGACVLTPPLRVSVTPPAQLKRVLLGRVEALVEEIIVQEVFPVLALQLVLFQAAGWCLFEEHVQQALIW